MKIGSKLFVLSLTVPLFLGILNFKAQAQVTKKLGVAGDIPVPGNYDRDGRVDVAVWRPSNGIWYITKYLDRINYILVIYQFFASQEFQPRFLCN